MVRAHFFGIDANNAIALSGRRVRIFEHEDDFRHPCVSMLGPQHGGSNLVMLGLLVPV